jgi:hypothetical protein
MTPHFQDQITRLLESSPLPAFRHDAAARALFISTAAAIAYETQGRIGSLSEAQLGKLVEKLLLYCSKKSWRTSQHMAELAAQAGTIADAFADSPEALTEDVSLSAVLKKHTQLNASRAAALTVELRTGDTPPVFLKNELYPGWHLTELFGPKHLIQQTRALGNCLGTSYNDGLLKEKGLTRTSSGADQYLTYAIKLRSKEIRLFSLHDAGGDIRASIQYSLKTSAISQVEGRFKTPHQMDGCFYPLCEALHLLAKKIPVASCTGMGRWNTHGDRLAVSVLPASAPDEAIHAALNDPNLKFRAVVVNDATPQARLEALLKDRRLTLDISQLSDLSRLPATVKASLYSHAETFCAPHLRTVHNIFTRATTVDLSGLEKAGELHVENAGELKFPKLKAMGSLCAFAIAQLSLPVLERCKDISSGRAVRVDAPLLKKAHTIATDARLFSMPQLESAHHLALDHVDAVSLPALKSALRILANGANTLYLPKLETAHDIEAKQAEAVTLSALKKARDLRFTCALEFHARELETAQHIYIWNAHSIDLLGLRSARSIHVPKAVRPPGDRRFMVSARAEAILDFSMS